MSEESLEIPNQNQIKCPNLEKFKQIDSEEFEKILNLTNKKPIFTKINRRKLSFSKIELSSNQSHIEEPFTQNICTSNRNSLVKNICSFLENKIQNSINSDVKNNYLKKKEPFSFNSNSESSLSDICNAKINISLNSFDYSIKCEEFDGIIFFIKIQNLTNIFDLLDFFKAFEQSNNNNNNNEKKNKDDGKSKSKDKHRDKEDSKKSKLNESEKRVRRKSGEKEKKQRHLSITKVDQVENNEKKDIPDEKSSNSIEKPTLIIELEADKNSNQAEEDIQVLNEPGILGNESEIREREYSNNELDQKQEELDENSKFNENIEVFHGNDLSDIMNQAQLTNVTSSYSEFRSSVDFSTSTKKQEDELKQNLPLQTASKLLQYISSFISVTTPENKNLWLSLIEKTGDSIIDILTMKDEENRNIWLTWLKDQCSSLDQLSKDLINDIEAKIMRIEYKNY